MSIRAHATWSAGAAILLISSRFLLLTVLARRLEPQALGLFAYAQWMVDIGFLVASLGAGGAAARYIAEYRSQPGRIRAFMRLWRPPSLLMPLAGALLAILGVGLSGADLDLHGKAALLLWALFAGLWTMQTAVLTGLQRFELVFLANFLAASAMLLGAAVMPMTPSDPSSALFVMAIGCALAVVVGLVPVRKLSVSAEGQSQSLDRTEIFRYCINVWIAALLWSLVWSRGEVPLVKYFLGDAQLAAYSVSLSLLGGAVAGVMLGVGGIAPQVTRLLGDGLADQAVELCRRVGDWQLLITGSASAALIWLAPELISLAFGQKYLSAAPVLSVLAAGLPALSFSMHSHFLQIKTGARFSRDVTLIGLVVLGVGSIMLIPRLGIEGAALARVAALWLLAVITASAFSLRAHQGGVNWAGFAIVILATGMSSSAVALLPSLPLVARIGLAAAIPMVLLFLIRSRDGRLAISAILRRPAGL